MQGTRRGPYEIETKLGEGGMGEGDYPVSRRLHLLAVVCLLVPLVPGWAQSEEPGPLSLPSPPGEHRVGQVSFLWQDESRAEGATEDPTDHRLLPVHIWYPAAGTDARRTAPYVADLEPFGQVWGPKTLGLAGRVRTNALTEAPVSELEERYPVVLFSHGWREMARAHSILLESLASRGYVAVGIDHPYMGEIVLTDGQVTRATEEHFSGTEEIHDFYGADVRFVLDQLAKLDLGSGRLAGRLDLQAVAAIGHSSGFVAVSAACRSDERIRACVNYDAPGFDSEELLGLTQPLLWLRADRADSPPAEFLRHLQAPVYEAQIDGGLHDSFTDWPYLKAEGREGRERALRCLGQIEALTMGFLELHLRSRVHW